MIIEFKALTKILSYSSLSMDDWYYSELIKADILLPHDDLSQNMKDYIFDNGNIRECTITHGSYLYSNYVKYIIKPSVFARFEIDNKHNLIFNDGDILHTHEDFELVKNFLDDLGIYTLYGFESLDDYMFIEITL